MRAARSVFAVCRGVSPQCLLCSLFVASSLPCLAADLVADIVKALDNKTEEIQVPDVRSRNSLALLKLTVPSLCFSLLCTIHGVRSLFANFDSVLLFDRTYLASNSAFRSRLNSLRASSQLCATRCGNSLGNGFNLFPHAARNATTLLLLQLASQILSADSLPRESTRAVLNALRLARCFNPSHCRLAQYLRNCLASAARCLTFAFQIRLPAG